MDIIDSFKDERIKIITQSKGSLASALNEGLAKASGNYIVRQDSDDYSAINRFSILTKFLINNPNVDLIGSYFYSIDMNNIVLKEHKPPLEHDNLVDKLLRYMIFAGPSIFGRKSFFNEVGGYDEFFDGYLGEDYDFVVRASEMGKLATVPNFLYF
jgi:glycosyltransferase involved in cell wall biosynthesis